MKLEVVVIPVSLVASAVNFAVGLLAPVTVAYASGERLQAGSLSNLPP